MAVEGTLGQLRGAFEAGTLTKAAFVAEAMESYKCLFDHRAMLSETGVQEIRITADDVVFVIGPEEMELTSPRGDQTAPPGALYFGSYEPDATRVIDAFVGPGQTVLDIGANIGWHSVWIALQPKPGIAIYAFEPMPETFSHLSRNVARNNVGHLVTCLNYGLSNANGAAEFHIAPELSANASLRNVADRPDAVPVTAATLTLDAWAETFGVAPDFVKCDVEGAELLVFQGGERTIEQHRPAVLTELLRKWARPYGYHPNDVIALFAKYGYACFAVTGAGLTAIDEVTEETVETNFVFADPAAHRASLETLLVA